MQPRSLGKTELGSSYKQAINHHFRDNVTILETY